MKLNELHVDEFRSGVICKSMTVTRVFPTVTSNFISATDPTGGQHDCFRPENFEAPPLAFVSKGANHAVAVLQQRKNRVLHVHVDALVNTMILQRTDHLQTRTITHVRKPRIFVATEMSLQNSAVFGAIENGAPRLKLAHAIRRFLGMQLDHAPLVHILTAAHRIGEMHFPIVALIDVGQRRRDSAFGHHRVRFA